MVLVHPGVLLLQEGGSAAAKHAPHDAVSQAILAPDDEISGLPVWPFFVRSILQAGWPMPLWKWAKAMLAEQCAVTNSTWIDSGPRSALSATMPQSVGTGGPCMSPNQILKLPGHSQYERIGTIDAS